MKSRECLVFGLGALLVILVMSCSPTGHSFGEGSGRKELGTGDGGGGNTCQGRPIESYKISPTDLPSYKNKLQTFFFQLRSRGDDVSRLLNYSLNTKNWYVIPCELQNLQSDRIGALVSTEQAALQTFREVWISQKIFQTMSESEQADLILHESLMGLRLLAKDSPRHQCLAYSPDPNYCNQASDKALGTPKDLQASDYQAVRITTSQIRNVASDDIEDLLGRQGFDLQERVFTRKSDIRVITRKEFFDRLSRAKALGYMPSSGYGYGTDAVKHETCALDFVIKDSRLDVIISRGLRSPIHQTLNVPEHVRLQVDYYDPRHLLVSEQLNPSGFDTMKLGERAVVLHFAFSGDADVTYVEASELACFSSSEGQCSGMMTPKKSFDYFCDSEYP